MSMYFPTTLLAGERIKTERVYKGALPVPEWKQATDRPEDYAKDDRLDLSRVCLVAMSDAAYWTSTRQAMQLSDARAKFGSAAVIVEEGQQNVLIVRPAHGTYLPVEAFGREQGSATLMEHMPKIAASLPEGVTHLLVVQHDGFVCNPAAWTDEFLEYDYIGAPWPDDVVGNCGFWLTSRKFWEAVQTLGLDLTPAACHPIDVVLCRRHRAALEALGVRWGPLHLARRFSVEGGTYDGQFGFHGWAMVAGMVAKGLYSAAGKWEGGLPGERPAVTSGTPQTQLEQAVGVAQAGRFHEAATILEGMLDVSRDQHEAARHLARIYADQGHFDQAIPLLEYSRSMRPQETDRIVNLANTVNHVGDRERAGRLYEQAIAQSPDTPYFHWCYALWLLGQKRIKEGFAEYQWSYYCRSRLKRHPSPEWDGSPIPGKTLYICGEQGYGDAVMMSRFLPLVKERSQAHIVLETHEPMVPLFLPGSNMLPTGDQVVVMDPNWEFRTRFDHWINPFTIPFALGLEIEDVQAADLGRVPKDKASSSPRRVGICWRGAAVNMIDKTRSTKIDTFAPLLGIPGIQFVSLQYGETVDESLGIEQPDIRTMDRTFRVMQGLDAVVSVDTMVANLACTMGLDTHVMTTTSSDYRWGYDSLDGPRSPWYAAARVYRQKHGGDYEDQIQAVKQALMDDAPSQETHHA